MKLFISFIMILFLSSCNTEEIDRLKKLNQELSSKNTDLNNRLNAANADANKISFLKQSLQGFKARFITDKGIMEAEFYPDLAPIHVALFISRAENGFYNGLQFHRVIPGFMIQGGDPNSRDNNFEDDGLGAPRFATPHEFSETKHINGILSTARSPDIKVGAGSQFFIMNGTTPHLDKKYTVFGKVYKGLDVVEKIVSVERYQFSQQERRADRRKSILHDHPKKAVRIQRIEIFK